MTVKVLMRKAKTAVKVSIISVFDFFWSLYVKVYPYWLLKKRIAYLEPANAIVSLTSFPKRLGCVNFTIKSIFLQSVPPKKIILYLGSDTCWRDIPQKLIRLQDCGLTISFKEENLRSHKKYVYSLQEYKDYPVILVDDDLIYEHNMIKLLMDAYERYPNCISAKRVHKMLADKDENIIDYALWKYECRDMLTPSHSLFATTGGGTLLPPYVFSKISDIAFNRELFMNYCESADDVWIKFMSILADVKVVFVKGKHILPIVVHGSQKIALNKMNCKTNDVYIRNLEELFNIHLGKYC